METINEEKKINKIGRQLDMKDLEKVTGGAGDGVGYLFFEGESEEQKDMEHYGMWVDPIAP